MLNAIHILSGILILSGTIVKKGRKMGEKIIVKGKNEETRKSLFDSSVKSFAEYGFHVKD